MTIYRTRYRDPKERRWMNAWLETRVTAEFRRAEIERRYGRKDLDVQIERFEVNPGALRTGAHRETRGASSPCDA